VSQKDKIAEYLRKFGPADRTLIENELSISQPQVNRALQDTGCFNKETGINALFIARGTQPTNIPSLVAWNLWFSLKMYNRLHKLLTAGIDIQEINRLMAIDLAKHLARTDARLNQLMDKYGINPELDNEGDNNE
jgi:hypothetical protein